MLFIHKYLEVLVNNMNKQLVSFDLKCQLVIENYSDGECVILTLVELIRISIKVANIHTFLCDLEKQFTAKTVVNYCSMLQWHLVYLCYLLHWDMNTKLASEGQIQTILWSMYV